MTDRSTLELRRGEDGSLAFALLFALVGTAVVALLSPMVITQIKGTQVDVWRQHTLQAAQSGLDVALGAIQNTTDQWGNGVRSALPRCGATLSGGIDSVTRYQVTIDYYTVDPSQPAAVPMCTAGASPPSVPAYALFRSVGTDQTTGQSRTLRGTYTFQTTNVNIAGGMIHMYHDAGVMVDLCLTAASGNPASGSALTVTSCVAGSTRQSFAYTGNLQLVLVSSQSPPGSGGMCINANTNQYENQPLIFRPCGSPAPPAQQWFLNNWGNLEGTNDGTNPDGFCMNVVNPDTSGSAMVLRGSPNCRPAMRGSAYTVAVESSVGSGRAGPTLHQLLNYQEFGRCIDIPQSRDPAYVTAWHCVSAADYTGVAWHEVWNVQIDQTGPISSTSPGSTYYTPGDWCLASPLSTAPTVYVDVAACTVGGTVPTNMRWTAIGDTGDYATSYVIKDAAGNCLTPTDPNATPPDFDTGSLDISKIKVAVCDGSDLQKWNAPPNIVTGPPLTNIRES